MELRHLRYFLAIAHERHFTRAAERLGIAQPPLSQQIKQLESEVGAPLFVRTARGVTLTDAGRAFLPHAESAVREAERAAVAAQRVKRGEQGAIRVGFTISASLNPLVPAIISGFRSTYPDVELGLSEHTTATLLAHLRSDLVDVAFLRPTQRERENLTALELPKERFCVAVPASHRLASRKHVQLAELAEESFILYPRSIGILLYDSIIAACRNAGFSPRIVQEAPQMVSTVNLVAAGVGVALVLDSVCQIRAQGVSYVRLAGLAPGAFLWLVHQRTGRQSTCVDNFMQHAERFLAARDRSLIAFDSTAR
jgi:DNA-binding transcriptional LysR family regulator